MHAHLTHGGEQLVALRVICDALRVRPLQSAANEFNNKDHSRHCAALKTDEHAFRASTTDLAVPSCRRRTSHLENSVVQPSMAPILYARHLLKAGNWLCFCQVGHP